MKVFEAKTRQDSVVTRGGICIGQHAPHFVIGPEQIKAAAPYRRGNTLCLIDISVPRNVDPAVHELDDTYLYDIDDLEEVARDGRREREAVAERWRPKLAQEAREVLRQLQDMGSKEAARRLIEHCSALRQHVLSQVRREGLTDQAILEIERALERMQGRLIHGPLDTLKQAAREGDGDEAAAWVSRLFRLEAGVGGETEKAAQKKSCKQDPPTSSGASARPSAPTRSVAARATSSSAQRRAWASPKALGSPAPSSSTQLARMRPRVGASSAWPGCAVERSC